MYRKGAGFKTISAGSGKCPFCRVSMRREPVYNRLVGIPEGAKEST